MLTSEQAHSLVVHIGNREEPPEPVDPHAVEMLLQAPHNPNGLWQAIAQGERRRAGALLSLETMAALLYELAARCPGVPEGKHSLYPAGVNHHPACEYCGLHGDAVHSLQAWNARHEQLQTAEQGSGERESPA